MVMKCELTGKSFQTGNNVSHAHNKTRRRFLPNLQKMTLFSETLGPVSLKITATALRTIEQKGGLDDYLLGSPVSKLSETALKLRKRIKKVQAKIAA